MKQATSSVHPGPGSSKDALSEVLRVGAQRMLATAIEAEVATYIEEHEELRDDDGRRLVVRNGHKKPRSIDSGIGEIEIRQPRVNDRRIDDDGHRIRFSSKVLPVSAANAQPRGSGSLALSEGNLDERFLRVPAAASGNGHRESLAASLSP